MTIALAERGVRERVGEADHPRIVQYLATTSLPERMHHDETPWCSAFANWCVEQAGYRGTGKANARSWLTWGTSLPIDEPRHGCIAVFWRGDPMSPQGHVGFYVRNGTNRIWVCGGNQLNAVSISAYPRHRLLGYRWPSIGDRKV
jgi:uncharacterized protein (TIGR02594 family)